MAQPTKQDFINNIEIFTKNVEDRVIAGNVNKTFDLDFNNVIPQNLLVAIKSLDLQAEDKPQLKSFYSDYLLKAWVNYAFVRFLTTHGKNITQFGIQFIADQDARTVDDENIAFMIKRFDKDAGIYLSKATAYLKSVNYILDNTDYSGNNDQPLVKKRNRRITGI